MDPEASSWRPKLLGANPSNQLREDSNISSMSIVDHVELLGFILCDEGLPAEDQPLGVEK